MKEQLDKWMTEYLYLLEQEEDSLERNEMQNKYLHVRRNYDLFCKHLGDGKCFFCSECGVVEHINKNLSDKCHTCTTWSEREAEHLESPKIIINGVMYTDAGNSPNGRYLGFGGTVYTINHKDGTQTITNNLWHGGVIPKKYRLTTMKDNAEFVHEKYMYSSTAYKSC